MQSSKCIQDSKLFACTCNFIMIKIMWLHKTQTLWAAAFVHLLSHYRFRATWRPQVYIQLLKWMHFKEVLSLIQTLKAKILLLALMYFLRCVSIQLKLKFQIGRQVISNVFSFLYLIKLNNHNYKTIEQLNKGMASPENTKCHFPFLNHRMIYQSPWCPT